MDGIPVVVDGSTKNHIVMKSQMASRMLYGRIDGCSDCPCHGIQGVLKVLKPIVARLLNELSQ
jgi:hypothetical protein